MKNYEQIAAAMYAAWEKEVRGQTGIDLLAWTALPAVEQRAWVAAARQAAAELALVH